MKARAWAFFALAMSAASACLACPGCKDAMGNTPQTEGLAKGFYYSIVFMLSVVFGLVGFLVYKIVKEAKGGPAVPPAA